MTPSSPPSPTSRAAPFIIAAAILAGGHMMLVDPAKRRLAQARAEAAKLDADDARLSVIQSALPAITAAAPRQAPEVPALRLTAILDNRTGGMAAIDGRILRPGDEAAPGWRLLSIDAANNRIVIADDRGHTATIELSPRGAGF